MITLIATVSLSCIALALVLQSIPKMTSLFIAAGLFGKDLCKRDQSLKIPESQGLICGTVFLMVMFAFVAIRFGSQSSDKFPHLQFSQYLSALLSICCMLLLGFADDVLNLRWKYKLLLPTIASTPLLMVYYINQGSTTVMIPKPLRDWVGLSLNIGPLYYLFMSLLAVFCTNAINIYAGINGLESGQAFIIAVSVTIFNLIELGGHQYEAHLFSLSLVLPFASTCAALYYYNRYPAKVFVGDTFTYFAGMTFAVIGIIGHFSKTMLLFFIPQIINFLYSTPQLFGIIPCPRHRLPRYNREKDHLEFSETSFKSESLASPIIKILRILHYMKLIHFKEGSSSTKGDERLSHANNLTLINLVLVWFGPLKEDVLTRRLLLIQIICTVIAFSIRYPLANRFYD